MMSTSTVTTTGRRHVPSRNGTPEELEMIWRALTPGNGKAAFPQTSGVISLELVRLTFIGSPQK